MQMKFNLTTEITYKEESFALEDLAGKDAGYEACIYMTFDLKRSDPEFCEMWKGTREPLTEKEMAIFNSGLPIPPRDDEKLFLPSGQYTMVQLPAADDMRSLRGTLLPYAAEQGAGSVYVRFFRENTLTVMQFFFPTEN